MLKAAAVFQSGMILQREKPVPVWGTAAPGEAVTVEIQGRCGQGLADENGKWYIELPALTASRSEQMRIGTEQEQMCIRDRGFGPASSDPEFCGECHEICPDPWKDN